jgi:hypothetical protein
MYTQLYFHHVRRIYDFHLKQFLKDWLPGGKFSIDLVEHQRMTDTEVLSAMRIASADAAAPGHVAAYRILQRRHFRRVAEITGADRQMLPEAAELLAEELRTKFGPELLHMDRYTQKGKGLRFPVLTRDGKVEWSTLLSDTLKQVPTFTVEYVFVAPELADAARRLVSQFRDRFLKRVEAKESQQ